MSESEFTICYPDAPPYSFATLEQAVFFCWYVIDTGLDAWVEVDGVRLPEDEFRRILLEVFDIDVS